MTPLAMRGYRSSRIFCKSVFLLTFSTRDGIKWTQGLGLRTKVLNSQAGAWHRKHPEKPVALTGPFDPVTQQLVATGLRNLSVASAEMQGQRPPCGKLVSVSPDTCTALTRERERPNHMGKAREGLRGTKVELVNNGPEHQAILSKMPASAIFTQQSL